jgi:glutaredoxin
VYVKNNCPICKNHVRLLENAGRDLNVININSVDDREYQRIMDLCMQHNVMSFPVMFVNGEVKTMAELL